MSKILNTVHRYDKAAQGGIYTHEAPAPNPNRPADVTQSFPRGGLRSQSALDERMKTKMDMMDSSGRTPFGQVVATDQDFRWLQQKRETEAAANFDQWVGENFHNSIESRRWLQQVYPQYYQAREDEMSRQADFALKVKKIMLRGAYTQEELLIQWGLTTGRIKLDRDWDRIGVSKGPGEVNMATEQQVYSAGLFSPLKFKTNSQRGFDRVQNNNPFKTDILTGRGAQVPKTFPTFMMAA